MPHNKFSKFAINYLSSEKDTVYSYTALDEEKQGVLIIRPRGQFDVTIPASIETTCVANFIHSDYYEEITTEQFWRIFKIYTIKLYQYYQSLVVVELL